MYCTKCGSAVGETAAFCGACGQPAIGPSGSAGAPPPYSAPAAAPPQSVQPYAVPPGAPPVQPYGFVPLPSPYAGFWLRLVAHIIDSLLIGFGFCVIVLFGAAFVGFGAFRDRIDSADSSDVFFTAGLIGAIVLCGLILVVGVWLYYASMESSIHQGTLGKIALGLIVTDLQGRRVTFGRASGRFFAKIISNLIPLALAYIMAGFTEKKQALHDMIASCLVLRKN
jgi:uncharacterized RDD family membrane protein YckC